MKLLACTFVLLSAWTTLAHAGTTGNGSGSRGTPPSGPTASAPVVLTPVGPARPYLCLYPDSAQKTYYMSGIITTGADIRALSIAWTQYVNATFHLNGYVNGYCEQVHADAAGQQYTTQLIEKQQSASGLKVVHVDWHP